MAENMYPDVRGWRLKKQRYGLVGEVCPHCDYKIFPPRERASCPNCGAEGQVTLEMLVESQTEEVVKKVAMFAIEISTPQPVR